MKFEEALKAMREGKKVKRGDFKNCYYIKDNVLYCENSKGKVYSIDNEYCNIAVEALFFDDWFIVDDEYYSILKSVEEISPKDLEKLKFQVGSCAIEESKADKADLKITFIGGGEIVIPDEQWDDYHYDGKFFKIIKDGADIAMYNAKEVFSLVLVRHVEG